MYLPKQEASRLLFPWLPFSTLLLGPSFQKPDLYSITHGPQMLQLSFPSSWGGGGTPGTEMPVLKEAGLPQRLEGEHLSSPKHLENTASFRLEAMVGAG